MGCSVEKGRHQPYIHSEDSSSLCCLEPKRGATWTPIIASGWKMPRPVPRPKNQRKQLTLGLTSTLIAIETGSKAAFYAVDRDERHPCSKQWMQEGNMNSPAHIAPLRSGEEPAYSQVAILGRIRSMSYWLREKVG